MKNIESLSIDLKEFSDKVINKLIDAQRRTAEQIQKDTYDGAPVDTGKYRESIKVSETKYDGNNIKTSIYTDAVVTTSNGTSYNLGRLLEEGTMPHIIQPVNAPYLVFKGRDGKWVRTKWVSHPGMLSQPHFIPALNKNVALYKSNIDKAIKEAQ